MSARITFIRLAPQQQLEGKIYQMVLFIIIALIVIALIARNAANKVVYIALACLLGAALLCAGNGHDTPVRVVVGFVVFAAFTYCWRNRKG
jgi:lipoprotein signal peptidase